MKNENVPTNLIVDVLSRSHSSADKLVAERLKDLQKEVDELQCKVLDARLDFSEVRALISKCQVTFNIDNIEQNTKVTTAWELANKCVAKYQQKELEV